MHLSPDKNVSPGMKSCFWCNNSHTQVSKGMPDFVMCCYLSCKASLGSVNEVHCRPLLLLLDLMPGTKYTPQEIVPVTQE